ncbi:hypothetical protein [Burkholderia cepacia]|uniref:hypothetical protein n=1 Tax=Burkholderia cepacia TaxID=292 RepID=UPI000A755AB5|nr:hypothetical protein [Burkholderia cepacia]
MSVDDGLSYDEVTTQTEFIVQSQLERAATTADLEVARTFRDLGLGALTLWTTLGYRVALKIGDVDRFDADLERMNAMFPKRTLKL